jgi:hypothetical protein
MTNHPKSWLEDVYPRWEVGRLFDSAGKDRPEIVVILNVAAVRCLIREREHRCGRLQICVTQK